MQLKTGNQNQKKEENSMYEARKRTAVDGSIWWCVFNLRTQDWSLDVRHGRYQSRLDCECAITSTI